MNVFPSPGGGASSVSTADEVQRDDKAKPEVSAILIEPAELERQLNLRGLRILDTRPKRDYSKGHVPGAVYVDVATWQELGKTEGGFHNARAWGDKGGQLGIEHGSRVVVYGSRLPDTARIWWTLKYLGLGEAAMLNGGWEAWAKEKRTTETTTPKVSAARFEPMFQADRLEEIESLKASIRSGKVTVVDTRSSDEFTGKEIRGKRGGHIPGAKLLEWTELLVPDGRFKTPDELRELFRKRGLLPDNTAVCY
jgi:thiosulfate/3-mercaptopyruvate sulfurtransferase